MATGPSAMHSHTNPPSLSSVTKPTSKSINQKSKPPTHSLLLYHHILTQGNFPNKPTIISAIKACQLISALQHGKTIHAQIIKSGSKSDRFIATSLISFYCACSCLSSAEKVFDGITEKDPALQTSMLVGYVKNGAIDSARWVFDSMPERDTVAWNAMLSGYAQTRLPNKALELFREMQINKTRPNEVTLVSALSACSQLSCLAIGEWIHSYITNQENISFTSTLSNALVHMYAKCGLLDAAFEVFSENQTKNLESWNTMLTSFAIHGCGRNALSIFSQMMKMGLMPDRITFMGILMACSHGGMVDHARRCLEIMRQVYGIEAKAEHYGCMVDVLSRNGLLEEALSLIENMPFEPDVYVWGSLLGGCRSHQNYKLGLLAARKLVALEPHEESRYIALSNLYAIVGKVEDAVKVRKMVTDVGIKKSGSSTIEVDGLVHEFLAGDSSHIQSKQIYSMIEEIGI